MKHIETTAEVFSVATGASSAILVSKNPKTQESTNQKPCETETTLSALFLLAVGDLAGWQGVKVLTFPEFWTVNVFFTLLDGGQAQYVFIR